MIGCGMGEFTSSIPDRIPLSLKCVKIGAHREGSIWSGFGIFRSFGHALRFFRTLSAFGLLVFKISVST